jgi:hypothetical protein
MEGELVERERFDVLGMEVWFCASSIEVKTAADNVPPTQNISRDLVMP